MKCKYRWIFIKSRINKYRQHREDKSLWEKILSDFDSMFPSICTLVVEPRSSQQDQALYTALHELLEHEHQRGMSELKISDQLLMQEIDLARCCRRFQNQNTFDDSYMKICWYLHRRLILFISAWFGKECGNRVRRKSVPGTNDRVLRGKQNQN